MVDIPGDDTTNETLAVGGTYVGEIEVSGDRDWVAVTLQAGMTYSFALSTPGASGVNDTFVSIFGANSVLLGSDDDGGNGLDSLATYTPTVSGVYYVEARAFGNGTGTYRLSVNETAPPSFLDSIDWGTQMATSSINVYFAPRGEVVDGRTSRGWSAYEIEQTMLALQQFSDVCDVSFQITSDAGAADFTLATTRSQSFLGYFNPPGTAGAGSGVMADNGQGWDDFAGGGLEQGGYGFITLIHEFGHGMGMAHPHDGGGTSTTWEGVTSEFDSYGTFELNQGIYTVMSYNDGWETNPDGAPPALTYGWQGTMMAFDIAMLQSKYGANTNFHDGNDTYQLKDVNASGTFYSCIWDTGGVDEIAYGGSANANIDLRTAHLGYAVGSGGFISFASGIFGGFTIANGVIIENASGGSGDDTIRGNERRNVLDGNGGEDALIGGAGRDRLIGGNGADMFAFLSLLDSGGTAAKRDTIADFRSGIDHIDLEALDGRSNGTANDAFIWIDADAFSNVRGQLHWVETANGTLIEADRTGDGVADFSLMLVGVLSVSESDFTL